MIWLICVLWKHITLLTTNNLSFVFFFIPFFFSPMVSVTCTNYSCWYAEKEVIQDFSYTFASWKIYAIVWPSGVWKSTLLHAIATMDNHFDYQSWQISRDGHATLSDKDFFTQKKKIWRLGYMFQSPTLFPHLTVRQNIALPLQLIGASDEAYIDALLDTVGLTSVQNALPASLSWWMKTRVSLARTYSTKPDLILLDEPFWALDIARKEKLHDDVIALSHKLWQKPPTIILVTHDIQEALYLTNMILVSNKQWWRSEYRVQEQRPRISHHAIITDFSHHIAAMRSYFL